MLLHRTSVADSDGSRQHSRSPPSLASTRDHGWGCSPRVGARRPAGTYEHRRPGVPHGRGRRPSRADWTSESPRAPTPVRRPIDATRARDRRGMTNGTSVSADTLAQELVSRVRCHHRSGPVLATDTLGDLGCDASAMDTAPATAIARASEQPERADHLPDSLAWLVEHRAQSPAAFAFASIVASYRRPGSRDRAVQTAGAERLRPRRRRCSLRG